MGRNNKKKTAPKGIAQKAQQGLQKPMTLEEQIAVVEDKILADVKKLSMGLNVSLVELSDAGSELRELEAVAEAQEEDEEGGDEDESEG